MERRIPRHSSFGQYVRGYVSKRNEAMQKMGGRNLGVRFGNRFNPPENHAAKIRLIPGEYKVFDGTIQPFYQYVQFFTVRTKKSFVSSKKFKIVEGNLEAVDGKCLGWDQFQKEVAEGIERDKRSISMRLLHAFTGIHLAYYHLVTVEKDGKPLRYKRGERKGEVIKEKVACEGRRCQYCRDKIDKVFGKKVHWSLGSGFLELLGGTVADIAQDCKNCGAGRLETVGWECESCGHMAVDETDSSMSDEEINALTCHPYKCNAKDPDTGEVCDHRGYLAKLTECDNCQDPEPTSLFDVDIEVKKVGEAPKVTIQIPRWTLTELDESLLKMAEPYKFDRIFSGDPLDKQAEFLKVKNPHRGEDAGRFTRDYNDKDKDEDETEADNPDYDE
jgi:hypothetical protein